MTKYNHILEHAKKALHLVRINIPYLAELTHDIQLVATDNIATAGVFASGKVLFNPLWFKKLDHTAAAFVIAHEIMHLALQTHHRATNEDVKFFNIAHDFIINDYLKKKFGLSETPANGLDWDKEYGEYETITNKSAEEIVIFLKKKLRDDKKYTNKKIFKNHWGNKSLDSDLNKPFADLLKHLFPSDILTEEFEKEFFSESTKQSIATQTAHIAKQAAKALSTKLIIEKIETLFNNGQDIMAGGNSKTYNAIRSFYQPPWEAALQTWLEFTTRLGRTYARPSRRGQSNEYVQAGSKREGKTIHIVIDTSGSMSNVLGKVLPVIASFCENSQIPEIHIIQCDTQITDDNWYTPDDLLNFQIKGLGGTDLSAAMLRLSTDNEVQYALVITDGYIGTAYPQFPMPYEVLWALTDKNSGFCPSYGQVMYIDN